MKKLLATALLFCVATSADAALIISSDTVIQDGDDLWSVEVIGNAHVDVLGGLIGNRLQPLEQSSVDISGGLIVALYLEDSTTANIFPGVFMHTIISTRGMSVLNVYGGRMAETLEAIDQSQVNLFVRDYNFTPNAGSWGDGFLTGTWADNTTFQTQIRGDLSRISFNQVVPEPSTYVVWFLIGLTIGGGYWWRRRKPTHPYGTNPSKG